MYWTPTDVITTDKYLAAFPQNYYKMDAIHYSQSVEWRGQIHRPPTILTRLIVSGHSDFAITNSLVRKYPIAKWFGVNNQSSRATGIPLGITNNTNESDVHAIYGNVDMMAAIANTPRTIKNLVYMNFATNTYPTEREHVWNLFDKKEWVTVGKPVNTLDGRKDFLAEMRNHEYVICPRGNGIDTHRIWEALYMGSIPVVRWDMAHAGWTDLPILFISSWEDVTEELLRGQLSRFQTTRWNLQKLHVGYWINHIREVHNEDRNGSRRN